MLHEAESALAEGATIPVVCRNLGISEATFHRWRKRYVNDGLPINGGDRRLLGKEDLVKRVKEL
jgi:transposase-like protein